MSESQAATSASSSSGSRNMNDNNGLEASATVEEQFASISAKLNNLIQNTETKTSNIRNRILSSSLEPHFLALEQKVVASEYVNHLKELQNDVNRLKQIATEEKLNKENDLKSQSEIFKEELFKDVIQLLESEMSCVVCSEVFIKPAVIDCGHSYCNYCINKWTKESQKKECPICRKIIVSCTKHVEFDNFICKIYALLSQEIRDKRLELVAERERLESAIPNNLPAPARQRMPGVFRSTHFTQVANIYAGGFGNIEDDDDIAARLLFEQELDHMFYYNPGRMSSTPVPHSYPSSTGDYDDRAAWIRRMNDAEESEADPHTPISVEPIVSSDDEENEMDTMPQNDIINDPLLESSSTPIPIQQSQQYSNPHSFDLPQHYVPDTTQQPQQQVHRCPYMNGSANNSSTNGFYHQHIHPSIPYINVDVAQRRPYPQYPRVNEYSIPMYHHPTTTSSTYPAYQVPPPAHQQTSSRNYNYLFCPPPAHQQQHRTYYNEPPRNEQTYRNNNYTSNPVFSRSVSSNEAIITPIITTGNFGTIHTTTPPDAFVFPIPGAVDSNSTTANNNTEEVENRSNNSASRSQSESPEVVHEVINNRGASAHRHSYFPDYYTNPNSVVNNINGNGGDQQFAHRIPHQGTYPLDLEVPNHRQSRNETTNFTEQNINRIPEGLLGQSLRQHHRIRRYSQNVRRPNSSSGSPSSFSYNNRNNNNRYYRFRIHEDHSRQ